ncbi:VOC family protein, partial [Mycobacterium tuberculosis]|nr:VOC family protein [Mycobacterium tuberculosis]
MIPAHLDHLVVTVPDLAAGVDDFARATGVRPVPGVRDGEFPRRTRPGRIAGGSAHVPRDPRPRSWAGAPCRRDPAARCASGDSPDPAD